MATASSRRCAIASSVRCSTATLLRIVQPERPETVGGRSASPGVRTDQLRGDDGLAALERSRVRPRRLGDRAGALDFNEERVGVGAAAATGHSDFRRGCGRRFRVLGTGKGKERRGEVFAGVEGTPLSEPLLVRIPGLLRWMPRSRHSSQ